MLYWDSLMCLHSQIQNHFPIDLSACLDLFLCHFGFRLHHCILLQASLPFGPPRQRHGPIEKQH